MNRKHNPWVALVALLLGIALVILCAGCGVSAEATEPGQPTETAAATEPTEATEAAATGARFKVEWDSLSLRIGNLYIVTDRHTGAQYLVVKDTNALAMVELESVEG